MICVENEVCKKDEGRVMRTVEQEGKELRGKVGCNWTESKKGVTFNVGQRILFLSL
jgi:hypothetical protein